MIKYQRIQKIYDYTMFNVFFWNNTLPQSQNKKNLSIFSVFGQYNAEPNWRPKSCEPKADGQTDITDSVKFIV